MASTGSRTRWISIVTLPAVTCDSQLPPPISTASSFTEPLTPAGRKIRRKYFNFYARFTQSALRSNVSDRIFKFLMLHSISSHRAEGPSSPLPWRGDSKKAVTLTFLQLHSHSCSYTPNPAVRTQVLTVSDASLEPLV